MQTKEPLRGGSIAVDGLRANGDKGGGHHASGFDCHQSVRAIFVCFSDGLIHFHAGRQDECLNLARGKVGLGGVGAFVGRPERNGWPGVANHSIVTGSANRASRDDRHLGGNGGDFFDQTNDFIGAVELGEVKESEVVRHSGLG